MSKAKHLPSRSAVVAGFLERHTLTPNDIVPRVEPAVYWTDVTLLLLQSSFASANAALLNDPTSGLLLNMLNRNFEAVDGAVLAFVTGCGPTSELSSRASIEFSASIAYILLGDRRRRLLSYFKDYIGQAQLQARKWREAIPNLPPAVHAEHDKGVALRQEGNDALAWVVERIRETFGIGAQDSIEAWPKVAGRFEAIGSSDHYRTVYARLSSQTHSDAEETLRYFVGKISGNETLFNQMAIETVEFTRMMLLFAVADFIRATILFASVAAWSETVTTLRMAQDEIDGCLVEVSSKIGSY